MKLAQTLPICALRKSWRKFITYANITCRYEVADFAAFTTNEHFDAILNVVGVSNPAQAAAMGASIFDVTLKYDELALGYMRQHPTCRYILLSSGAAYGSRFEAPADDNAKAVIDIKNLQPQDWYGEVKLHAECRNRSLAHLPIVDIRVFNYFSHTQDIEARFLITDSQRAIHDKTVLKTTSDYIFRDYLHPSDFYRLVSVMLSTPPATNTSIDCYSNALIDKPTLLAAMHDKFSLQYETVQTSASLNATGGKPHYYSLNARAVGLGYLPALTSLQGVLEGTLSVLTLRANEYSMMSFKAVVS